MLQKSHITLSSDATAIVNVTATATDIANVTAPATAAMLIGPTYTTILGPSSKFDELLAMRSQFDSVMASIFLRLHLANPLPLCDRFLRFIVLFFYEKKIMRHFVTDAAMFTLRD